MPYCLFGSQNLFSTCHYSAAMHSQDQGVAKVTPNRDATVSDMLQNLIDDNYFTFQPNNVIVPEAVGESKPLKQMTSRNYQKFWPKKCMHRVSQKREPKYIIIYTATPKGLYTKTKLFTRRKFQDLEKVIFS